MLRALFNMKSKHVLDLALVVVVGCTIAGIFIARRPSVETATPHVAAVSAPETNQPVTVQAEVVKPPVPEVLTPEKPLAAAAAPVTVDRQTNVPGQNPVKPKKPGKEISDPYARAVLSAVGTDPAADKYWMAAINNPDLPAGERKDLIEDLNEDGLSDPKHPSPEDMPLIVNRLKLIEQLAPNAMDQVNRDAFAEAYKDLNNMLAGQPVK